MIGRARWWAALAVAVSACGPRIKPGLHAVGSPTGVVRGDALVVVEFDRPMVKPEQVGKEEPAPPLRITPPLAGRAEWVEATTLVVHPADRPPRSTRYTALVPRGTR